MLKTTHQLEDDFVRISQKLERHHALFYQFWLMGHPCFSNEIETACVRFNDIGRNVDFLFNEEFYNSLSDYEREFVICHEILHVVLNHGARLRRKTLPSIANVAVDIVVNHLLTDRFGFDRSQISSAQDICWVDTVFKDNPEIKPGETAEFYYEQLIKDTTVIILPSLDNHSGMSENNWDDVIESVSGSMSNEEKETLKDIVQKHYESDKQSQDGVQPGGKLAGTQSLGKWVFVNVETTRKQKWETVIKKWAMPFLQEFKSMEQWARLNRRFALLDDTELLIPSEMEDLQIEEPKKIQVLFFLDTSGSCWGLKDRFFKAALSLPPWRFKLDLCCFDCSVYPTTLESRRIAGGGGTSFRILEEYTQRRLKEGVYKEYPFVFVITDGHGDSVFPQKPENWSWFLSCRATHCIPPKSHIFNLSDFE